MDIFYGLLISIGFNEEKNWVEYRIFVSDLMFVIIFTKKNWGKKTSGHAWITIVYTNNYG